MMKDSGVDAGWLREQMAKNPPSVRPNGDVFTGPVRLSFPNLFEPGRPAPGSPENAEGKYGAALLFPPGTDMEVFNRAWHDAARAAFPNNWTPDGRPVNLHSPFHAQDEKAYGAKPLAGYTPGGIYFSATSKYKPQVCDASLRPVTDPTKVYPGVWAFAVLNVYHYKNLKTGVSFGLQQVMLIQDDNKLGGGGGDPKQAFGHVTITAQANVAARFDEIRRTAQDVTPGPSVMPQGGHVGQAGGLPVHPLPGGETEDERMMREMMG